MVASFSAVEYGKLFYRSLERSKIRSLRASSGDFDAFMVVNSDMKSDLLWWIENVSSQQRKIDHGQCDLTIYSDASMSGWGAVMNDTHIGGRWSNSESENHINYLELLACFFALKSFCKLHSGIYVKIMMDNTTAVSYVNNMGGITSLKLDRLAKDLWLWCIERNIWISASHIPGETNVCADHKSRKFDDQLEWMLDPKVFKLISDRFGEPEIDLFASRLNKQTPNYCSWKPDPEAMYVNAFSVDWSKFYGYLNPPFSLLGKCVKKVRDDNAECIVVAPLWPTQTWFPQLLELLVENPVILPRDDNLLMQPDQDVCHPLIKTLTLMACRVSGVSCRNEEFLQRQPLSSWHLGAQGPKNNMIHSIKGGFSTVIKGRLIHFFRLLRTA
ncbi:hypothetical protein FSP39_005170 [Pinctada imbricata]|nr:hypothetical protein FSP39_005170 [Pinctada imbricata]